MSQTPTPNSPIAWADPVRQQAFERWLTAVTPTHQLEVSSLGLASADASFRRYFRIGTKMGQTRIIMDAPPERENSRPFVHVAGLMTQAGLNAPEVLAWDEAAGFMLLTDLGSQTMLQHMIEKGLEPDSFYYQDHAERFLPLFKQAITALVQWQKASQPAVLSPYDEALLSRELSLFPDWYLGRYKGIDITLPEHAAKRAVFDDAFALIKRRNLMAPMVYVHRDFMPRNLMVKPGTDQLGVLDFQDAVEGPLTYDIASLTRDAFVTWDEEFVMDVTIRYWEAARKAGLIHNGPWGDWADDFGSFYASVEWMGLQRHLKVAGIFARLTLRDGKPQYLADAPRFIHYIRHTCSRYNALRPMLRLIDEIEDIRSVQGYQFGR